MKFIWYTTELKNRNHWGGSFVGYHQSSALKNLGHTVQLLDPTSDFSFYVNEIKPDWVYVPVEFTQYPCFQNILYYKKIYKYGIVIGVGIFEKWAEKITGWDLLITQWYGKGVDNFPLQLHYVPHGFNPDLHFPTKQKILYNAVFIGRNQAKNRNPQKYIYKIKNVKYFGYGWPGNFEIAEIDELSKLYNQAIVCPNFHGINQKGDFCMLNERIYQILACGGFQICDYIPGMEDFFEENTLLWEEYPKEWVKKIKYYINHPMERHEYIQNGLKHVQRYSYHEIMKDFIKLL